MSEIFADTFYWIALAHPKDEWHKRATAVDKSLVASRLVTTDEVLVEFLTFFGNKGRQLRQKAVSLVETILHHSNINVVHQSHNSFLSGLQYYRGRPDKHYSMTDCISMETMRRLELTEVLTHDDHFTQEGFSILFRE